MKGLLAGLALLVALGVLFFFYASPAAPPDEMTAGEHEGIVTTIMGITDDMVDVWNAHDLAANQSFFHPEKTSFAWATAVHDYDGLEERFREVWSGAERQETSWTARKIEVLSEDLVLFQGSFDLKIFYSDGRVGQYPGTCHYTVLFEPYNGEWKITYGGYAYGGYQVIEEG